MVKMLANAYGYCVTLDDSAIVATGLDPNGIPRVYGHGITSKEADDQCKASIMEYVRGRPDTGPLDKWSIAYSSRAWLF